jgi:signal transduction histidine kinase
MRLTTIREAALMQQSHGGSPLSPDNSFARLAARQTFLNGRAAKGERTPSIERKCESLRRADASEHVAPLLLQRARIEELITAARRKDEFLAIVCHELRSPLAAIQNAVALLRLTEDGAAVQERMHSLIERQLRSMKHLADGLLDVSQISRGALRLQCERLDLRSVAHNAVETLESAFAERNHRLAAIWPQEPVWLHGDARRLEQVLVNLLGNASKYTAPGGEVALSIHTLDGSAIIRIRDSGIGIAHDLLPHIFDLFVQADEAAASAKSGVGIGLCLVRMVVELHDGTVIAASAGRGLGSEFSIRLPLTR